MSSFGAAVVNSKGMTRPAATAALPTSDRAAPIASLSGLGTNSFGRPEVKGRPPAAASARSGRRWTRASAGSCSSEESSSRNRPGVVPALAAHVASSGFGVSARISKRLTPGRSSDSGRNSWLCRNTSPRALGSFTWPALRPLMSSRTCAPGASPAA